MKKITAFIVAIVCIAISTASYAQLTTTTMKLIKGTSLVNFTATGVGTTTYTWPQAPSATRPMQTSSTGAISFAPITLSDNTNQVNGILGIANGGTGSNTVLNNGRIMISRSNAIVEDTVAPASSILHGNLSWSALSLTSDVSGILGVANGGTGASTLTANGILLGNGTSAVSTASLGNNQVLVGNTSAAPTARGIVAGNGINVAIDGSNITISNTLAGSSSATGMATYTADGTELITVTPGVAVSATSRIILTVIDATGGNLIAAGVTAMTATTFTISVSTDVNCKISWLITNP